jgi:hypothetical protein
MKYLFFLLLTLPFSSHASFFQITFQKGYFKYGYSLVDSKDKKDPLFILGYLKNNDLQSLQVLTPKTHAQMKNDFIKFTEGLKATGKNRRIASCERPVKIKAQNKESSFCADSLSKSDSARLDAWINQAQRYLGVKTRL